MSKVTEAFSNGKAFIPFLTAGDPNIEKTETYILELEKAGADLIEIGIDAVNSQLFCMDMEKLGREYAGKITFRGEIDRQFLLPFGTEEQVRQGVRRAFKALCPDGVPTGCIAQCEWGLNDPYENVRAVYDEWDRLSMRQ